ncbi:GTPase IMAP family member 9-like [Physella acuta]|uniref:GTPase IMAP family member 9-like n=1 Tax=Physella acuta TaxID=109671 RepID=UPI0027DC4F8B|nr:GTPase IMAP family member 9-like [Physella acuta]
MSQAKPRTTGVDFIILGKTGNGKSSTGNSILRRGNIFKPSYYTTSGTKIPQFEWSKFEGRNLQVVDSPGVFDTCEDEAGGITMVHDALQNAMLANPKGYHAFLVVLKYATRFTGEEQKTVDILKGILGKNFLKDYGIIVMTNGDTFEHDCQNNKIQNLQRFCANQKGPFKSILEECNNRIIVFNNITQDEDVRYKQVKQLIDMVDKLKNHGQRYTHEHFNKADQFYQHFVVTSSIPIISKEVLKEQSLIMHAITTCEILMGESEKIETLKSLLPRLDSLMNSLKEKDKGTGALKDFITHANNTKRMIDARIDIYTDILFKLNSLHKKAGELKLDEFEKNGKKNTTSVEESKVGEIESQEEQLKKQLMETEEDRRRLQWETTKYFFEGIGIVVKAFGSIIISSTDSVTEYLTNRE